MSRPELERAVLARNGRREGEEIRFQCPHPDRHTNGDANPSARYHMAKDVWCCDVCKSGGGGDDLSKLLGLEVERHGDDRIVATYSYTDEQGRPLFEVVRKVPKKFVQRRPDGNGGWIWNLKGVQRVLYRLPEVLEAVQKGRVVYVVEGEKDADNLAKLGLVATTNPGGAGKWRRGYSETLSSATVVLLRDNDTAGEGHVQKVTQALHGVAAEIRVVELPDLPAGGDVSNWIEAMEAGGAGTAEIVAELERLVSEGGVWEPPTSEETDERAGEALQELWALGRDPEPAAVQRVLARVAEELEGSNPLAVQTAREVAVRTLKGKVSAPARLVDAALQGLSLVPSPDQARSATPGDDPPYRATEHGLVHLKATKEGPVPVPLTNFTARIVAEIERDDGAETHRWFEIAAHHQGQERRFEVAGSEFPMMRWVSDKLGASAILNAGMSVKDHARAAIQHLSDGIASRTVFTHLGWRRIGEAWCYLHADGAIGPVGPVPGVETEPPSQLERFSLPEPPTEDDLERAVRASLGILEVAPDEIALPLYCAVWRSVLGAADFGFHVAGQTNEGKTELAALAEQHFGPGLDARHLPGSWSSTGNSLEVLAFAAKDALLVVDDFAPEGTTFDVQRLHREAARLIRAQGNLAGRNRLRADGSLRAVKYPRGLLLSTGEDVPNAHSVRARILILDLPQGGMDFGKLSTCQEDAASGRYAQSMAAFLQWVAGRHEELQERRVTRVRELRAQAQESSSAHRRTPSIVADLAFGLETFLGFTQDLGVLSKDEADELWRRGWEALGRAAAAQAEHHGAVEPTGRFLELVGSAISSGRAHLASRNGDTPGTPDVWGWRHDGSGGSWYAQGERIGWVDGRDLYLDPDASYRCAQQVATIDGISISARTLWKRMRDRELLASTDTSRGRNLARVTLQGARRKVVHLTAATILPSTEAAQPAQSAQEAGDTGLDGPFLWAGSGEAGEEPAHETGPGAAVEAPSAEAPGPIGPVGPVSDTQDPEWGEV